MAEDNLAMDRRLFGHSRAAHRLFGWCASCPDRTMRQGVDAWRLWGSMLAANQGATDSTT